MKAAIKYALFGLFAFLVFLLLTVPAELCYPVVKKRLRQPGQFDLYGIEGSWRVGRAAQLVTNGRRFADFEWTIDLFPLLGGQVSGRFGMHQDRGSLSGNLAIDQEKITITKVLAQMPAEQLQGYLPDLGLKVSGELKAVFSSMQFSKGVLTAATGAVVCRGVELLAAERLVLGDIKAQFVTESSGIKIMLSDGGGPLLLEGQILLKPDRSYSFTGSFAARDRKQPLLEDTLKLFGKPGSDGRIPLAYNGRLAILVP